MTESKALSNREEQVLKLLLEGYLQKQIGLKLGISESRVNDVKSIIKKKWNVVTDIEFFLTALSKGYLDKFLQVSNGLTKYNSNSTSDVHVNLIFRPSTTS